MNDHFVESCEALPHPHKTLKNDLTVVSPCAKMGNGVGNAKV